MNYKEVNPVILGFCGFKQSGKNTAASTLGTLFAENKALNFISDIHFESFAHGVKQDVADAFGITLQQLEERKSHALVRRVLQYTGTEWGRDERGRDVWIKQLENRVQNIAPKKHYIILVTDVRFPEEVEWIRGKGGSIITIERKGQKSDDKHESEKYVNLISPDFRVYNSGSMSDLTREIKFLYRDIVERYNLA